MINLAEYQRDGFAVVRGLIPDAVLDPMLAAIGRRVEALAHELCAAPRYEQLNVERRLVALCDGQALPPRSFDSLVSCAEMGAIVRHSRLLDLLAIILGPAITYHGNSHVRAHMPGRPDMPPWHQDAQFYGRGTEHMRDHMVQVWVPLVDADLRNGCLALVPASHAWGLLPGAIDGDANVVASTPVQQERIYRLGAERARAAAVVDLPMRKGDVLVFTNLTLHTGRANVSDRVRWSVDLRYESTLGSRPLTEAERAGYDVYHRRIRGRNRVSVQVRGAAGLEA